MNSLLGSNFEDMNLSRSVSGRVANSVVRIYERADLSRWIGDLDLGQYPWFVCVGLTRPTTFALEPFGLRALFAFQPVDPQFSLGY